MQVKEQVIDFEAWMSPAARAERKMKSLAARLSAQELTEFVKGDPLTLEEIEKLMSRRKAGKLEALIEVASIGFNKRFKEVGKYSYVMVW